MPLITKHDQDNCWSLLGFNEGLELSFSPKEVIATIHLDPAGLLNAQANLNTGLRESLEESVSLIEVLLLIEDSPALPGKRF